MVVIVNDVTYDTHTAERICKYEHESIGHWEWIFQALYKTPEGKYFMYETGGCGTEYAVEVNGKMVGGQYKIFPISEHHAALFTLRHCPSRYLYNFAKE